MGGAPSTGADAGYSEMFSRMGQRFQEISLKGQSVADSPLAAEASYWGECTSHSMIRTGALGAAATVVGIMSTRVMRNSGVAKAVARGLVVTAFTGVTTVISMKYFSARCMDDFIADKKHTGPLATELRGIMRQHDPNHASIVAFDSPADSDAGDGSGFQ
eukprot:TRINITY_DN66218_c15_g1_i1.p1 TRINITY_DN66218_c15_g1~~TRINITY_DN66218_c15_g1_i1.p1  ORF type:complete len:160 (+),score=61.52 TRINITY_DN66218_c15_g1_i1:65-544(+)